MWFAPTFETDPRNVMYTNGIQPRKGTVLDPSELKNPQP